MQQHILEDIEKKVIERTLVKVKCALKIKFGKGIRTFLGEISQNFGKTLKTQKKMNGKMRKSEEIIQVKALEIVKKVKLVVLRISSQEDSTSGILMKEDSEGALEFLCYTLEDEYREVKIKGETRVPAGTYPVVLRKEGGFNERYSKKFPDIHIGMLHVINVPNFEYILIHIGNTDEDTAGCLLVGNSQESNLVKKNGFVGSSTNAYKAIYPEIAKAIEEGQEVSIEYKNIG